MRKRASFFIFSLIFFIPLIVFSAVKIQLTLKKAIQKGLQSNTDWKIAKVKDSLYKNLKWEYLREYYPKFSIGFSKEENRVIRGADTRYYKLNFSFEQLLYDGGKISNAIEATRLERQINFLEVRGIERDVTHQIISQYFKVAGILKKKEVQVEHLQSMEEQTKLSQEEYKLGEITQLEFLEIKTKQEQSLYQLKQIENDLETQTLTLKKLLKIGLSEKILLKESLFESLESKKVKDIKKFFKLNDLIGTAYTKRKEMLSYFLAYKKAKQELKTIERSYIPSISLVGNYSLEGEQIPRNESYNVGVVFTFYFGGNTIKTNYDGKSINNGQGQGQTAGTTVGVMDNPSLWGSQYIQKHLALLQNKEKWESFKKELALELRSLYNGANILAEAYKISLKKLFLVRERTRISRLKLKLGEIKRLDLVELEIELLQAKLDLINAWSSYVLGIAEIESKVGLQIGSLKLFSLKI